MKRYIPETGSKCGCPDGSCHYPNSSVCEMVDVKELDKTIDRLRKTIRVHELWFERLEKDATKTYYRPIMDSIAKRIEVRRTRLHALLMFRRSFT